MKTWVIRFLFFIIFVMIAGLLMLSLLGGTSEAHRSGLEKSFSDFLSADIRLGQLAKFNIVPQLALETRQIGGKFRDTGNEFMIDRFDLAFGFSDLMFGLKRIENFRVENFRFAKESSVDLRIDYIRINNASALIAKGLFERKEFDLFIPMEKRNNSRASYSFPSEVVFSGHFGSLELKGKMETDRKESSIGKLDFLAGGDVLIAGEIEKAEDGSYHLFAECQDKQKWSDEQKNDFKTLVESGFMKAGNTCL